MVRPRIDVSFEMTRVHDSRLPVKVGKDQGVRSAISVEFAQANTSIDGFADNRGGVMKKTDSTGNSGYQVLGKTCNGSKKAGCRIVPANHPPWLAGRCQEDSDQVPDCGH